MNPTSSYVRKTRVRLNHEIRVPEVRLIDASGENHGVVATTEAIQMAEGAGLDLIEIGPTANPPVAKIADYGKFQYDQQKKKSQAQAKSHTTETKNIQIKIGTGEHDLVLKARRASLWLKEGHRVKLDLFLPGRTQYLAKNFLEERLERLLKFISEDYSVSGPPQRSPKGLTVVLERAGREKKIIEKTNENK